MPKNRVNGAALLTLTQEGLKSGTHSYLGWVFCCNAYTSVSNSLMYSIYKMLPNDTDLTVFREQKEHSRLQLHL
jgi:hypothetical protein